jgi:KaiC/GvpD/RAD55 family RecA-like ATPase
MAFHQATEEWYRKSVVEATLEENPRRLVSTCPWCKAEQKGQLVVDLDPASLMFGMFRCTVHCCHGGFAMEFARRQGLDLAKVPGFDPDAEPLYRPPAFPFTHRNGEMYKLERMCSAPIREPYRQVGISDGVLELMHIGYNGRLYVYPYLQEDGNCYSLRAISFAAKFDQPLWQGDEQFSRPPHNLYNTQDVGRAEGGTLVVTVNEKNLLALKQAGLCAVSIPTYGDESCITAERLQFVRHVVLMMSNDQEGRQAAQNMALRLGFKARLVRWDQSLRKSYGPADFLNDTKEHFDHELGRLISDAEPLSPLPSARRDYAGFVDYIDSHRGRKLLGFETCFPKLNTALDGLRGLNVLGAQPKAGKSTFFMQLATALADEQRVPVVYYDFENGRQKIYTRTLCRMARLSERQLKAVDLPPDETKRRDEAMARLRAMLKRFKVVTDRKINPDVMRKQIDFLRSETGAGDMLLVIDSLHKMPFGKLSERRSGIDEWLRNMEAIRDEYRVTFLIISELGRSTEGGYSEKPDLASFKETGDIEYTADNALMMTSAGSVYDHEIEESEAAGETADGSARRVELYLVASREMSPGKIASYGVDYPYWAFTER